jgi:hypothetical protein
MILTNDFSVEQIDEEGQFVRTRFATAFGYPKYGAMILM